jgi:hypothetical protein
MTPKDATLTELTVDAEKVLARIRDIGCVLELLSTRTVVEVLHTLSPTCRVARELTRYWSDDLMVERASVVGRKLRADCEARETGALDLAELIAHRMSGRSLKVEWWCWMWGKPPARA